MMVYTSIVQETPQSFSLGNGDNGGKVMLRLWKQKRDEM